MIFRFIKKLFFRPDGVCVIPVKEARLCVQCDHVIREPVCPVCTSRVNVLIGKILSERPERYASRSIDD